jgi:PHD/YefM family antitoxin component YafN of YafNO toxin-antitoxin module
MATHEPPAQSIDIQHVADEWPNVRKAVSRKRERIVLEEDGVPVAAIVSLQDLKSLARLDTERAERFKILDRIGAAFAHETPEESDRLAALALAEVREEMRRERECRNPTRRRASSSSGRMRR